MVRIEATTRDAVLRDRPGRLVLAAEAPTEEDRASYDACVVLPPPWDVEGNLAALASVRADRVVCQSEWGLILGALHCERHALPGPGVQAAFLCTNKYLCRERLREVGVQQPRYALVGSADEVRRADLGYPLVLKAVASTLGRLVRRVDHDEDLEEAVAAMLRALPDAPDVRRCVAFAEATGLDMGCDAFTQFLAESYADGPPRETDGLFLGDVPHVFGVTEQRISDTNTVYMEGYLFPSRDPDGLVDASLRALEAVGLRDSGFSIEFHGRELIEVNGRFGEDAGFPELFAAGLGEPPILTHMRGAAPAARPNGGHAVAYRNHYRPGTVRSVGTAAGVVPVVEAGEEIVGEPGTPDFYPHLAWSLASHPTSAASAYVEARRRVDAFAVDVD
jgi:hypothetical protein